MKKAYLFLTVVTVLNLLMAGDLYAYTSEDYKNQALTEVRLALWYTGPYEIKESKGEGKEKAKKWPEELERALEKALAD